jgi:hypothetical protein
MAHIFWTIEWLKVLWSDKVTFLVRGRSAKAKVMRNTKKGGLERYCEDCIQYQFHRGYTMPINAWGTIRYGYKSPLIFVNGTSKKGAFKQVNYLIQVLQYL